MLRFSRMFWVSIFAVLLVAVAGCGYGGGNNASGDMAAMPGDKATSARDAEAEAELAKLSPEDRKLAEKQRTCPVTDEPLGSMGVPCKVMIRDRAVFLCCAACEEKLKKDGDQYLKKLDRSATK